MLDKDDARELILAEWRAAHPVPSDNLDIDLRVFVEQVLAMPSRVMLFRCDGDRRALVLGWVEAFERERQRLRQGQYDEVATL